MKFLLHSVFELYHSPSCRCRFLVACLVLLRGRAVFQLQRESFIQSLMRGSVFVEFCAVFLLDIAILLKPFIIVRTVEFFSSEDAFVERNEKFFFVWQESFGCFPACPWFEKVTLTYTIAIRRYGTFKTGGLPASVLSPGEIILLPRNSSLATVVWGNDFYIHHLIFGHLSVAY